jgi:hypothetical protein
MRGRSLVYFFWRGVRVVEGARLESVYTRKGIAGSNPALSADQMNVPALPGILFGGDVTSSLGPDA